ncbi:MAG: amidohydrolase family protein [Clostridia bacterium]|nr:amidohydrolase family protein [Clostridia bacterium]
MIIDFHTHVFPDKIASRTVSYLAERGSLPPYSDGTATGLKEKMKEAGIDVSVSLPVLTSPEQFDSVNRYARSLNEAFSDTSPRIISFGGIHPRCEDIEGKMKFLFECGFLGVKIHPDYQDTFIDDEGYIRILESAKKYGLIVVTHSGPDAAYMDREPKCTPERVLALYGRVPYGKLVLSHYGANKMWEEVYDALAGLDLYFDTSLILPEIDRGVFKKILKKHGDDKILFATDSPWNDVKGDVKILKSYALEKETEEKILFKNAKKLLKI